MPLSSFSRLLGCEIALDPGSNAVRAMDRDGQLFAIPCLTARVHSERSGLLDDDAVGEEAARLAARPRAGIEIVRPIERGAVVDVEAARRVLAHVLAQFGRSRPSVVCGAGAGSGGPEIRALADALLDAGARGVRLVNGLVACAHAIHTSRGAAYLIMELGLERTGVGVATMTGVISSRRVGLGAFDLDLALAGYLRDRGLARADIPLARRLRESLGVADPAEPTDSLAELDDVLPRHVGAGVAALVGYLAETTRDILRRIPGEALDDVMAGGLVLAGAPALTPGLAEAFERLLGMPVSVAPNPAEARVRGLARLMADDKLLSEIAVEV